MGIIQIAQRPPQPADLSHFSFDRFRSRANVFLTSSGDASSTASASASAL